MTETHDRIIDRILAMKILLIEDDLPTSDLLSATLETNRYTIDAIADGAMGLDMALQWDYDLILLDILLPSLDGIEVCRRLRAKGCKTPILILTTQDSNEAVVAGLDAGADDYVAKSCAPDQLLARVRALLRRGGQSAAPILAWGALRLDPALARVFYQSQIVNLRPKEYTLLELFLRNPQRILNRTLIIDHLWSCEETPVEGSVTNLIKDLRRRLKSVGMQEDLIETVYGLGYRLHSPPTEIPPTVQAGSMTDFVSDDRNARGNALILDATERFRRSLAQRIADLEAAGRSLQAGTFTLEARQVMSQEVHKLAGGLGTFGYGNASAVAKEIEDLLGANLGQEKQVATRLADLLDNLRQAIAEPLSR